MQHFGSATVRLTFIYVSILMALSFISSIWLYNVAESEVAHIAAQSETVLAQPLAGAVQSSKDRTLQSLVFFNLFTFGAGTLASYGLARRTLKPIQKSYEIQANFATDASHELRTPLTALKAELQIAQRNGLPSKEAAQHMIDSSLAEVGKLQQLTERLLQLAEPGTQVKSRAESSLLQTLAAAQKTLQPIIAKKKLTIAMPLQDAQLAIQAGDIIEVLVIILDNAAKYSPANGTIDITCQPKGRMYELRIKDSGPGISAKDLPRIFERFYRGNGSGLQSGFGLGLAVAKNIVTAANGTIAAESANGTTIIVRLPHATSV